jgi:20S proteasome subunit beta 1
MIPPVQQRIFYQLPSLLLLSRRRSFVALLLLLWTLLCSASTTHIHAAKTTTTTTTTPPEIDLGTTLVALKYQDGVVVAADTRTSVSGYVSNKFARKINLVLDEASSSSSRCVICRSGSAADTQWLAKEASNEFTARKWRYQLSHPTVSQVAHYLRDQMRSNDSSLQASLICAGYDDDSSSSSGGGGGRIFGIAPGGTLWEEAVVCVSGSGSTFLYGHLDSLELTSRNLYSEEKAIALVTQLLKLSIKRDGSSGGLIRILVLNAKGVQEMTVYPQDTATSTSSDPEELSGFAKATTRQ